MAVKIEFEIEFEDGSVNVRPGKYLGDCLEPGEVATAAIVTETVLGGSVTYPITPEGIQAANDVNGKSLIT